MNLVGQSNLKFWHKLGAGDIIYSWMLVKQIGAEEFAIPNASNCGKFDQVAAFKRLANAQSYIKSFKMWPLCAPDMVNLREVVDIPINQTPPTIVRPYFNNFGLDWPGYSPWIEGVEGNFGGEYSVVNVTERYRDANFRWGSVLPAGPMKFIGLPHEYAAFGHHLRWSGYENAAKRLEYTPTEDLLDAATLIRGARAFFGNASACLALAQGMGHPHIYVELTPLTTRTCALGCEKVLNAA